MSQCKGCFELSNFGGRPVCQAIREGVAYRIITSTLPIGEEPFIDVENPTCQAGIASRSITDQLRAFRPTTCL